MLASAENYIIVPSVNAAKSISIGFVDLSISPFGQKKIQMYYKNTIKLLVI